MIPYDLDTDLQLAAEKERRKFPVHSLWASKLGHPCERYLELHQLAWEQAEPPSWEMQLLFDGGNVIEKHFAKPWLEKMGYEVYLGESFKWEAFNISGRLDFKIRKSGGPKIPVEVKGLNHYDWEKLNTVEDFLQSKKHYIAGYPAQLTLYMLKENQPIGLFMIVSKLTWKPKFIWIDLDYTFAEDHLKKAERVKTVIERVRAAKPATEDAMRGMLTAPIEWEDHICGRCDLRFVCQPGRTFGQGADVIDSTELEQQIDRMKELESANKEYHGLKKQIGEQIEGKKLICGKWLIDGKWIERAAYAVEASKYWASKYIPVKS